MVLNLNLCVTHVNTASQHRYCFSQDMHLPSLSLLCPLTSWYRTYVMGPAWRGLISKAVEVLVARLQPWLASEYVYQNQIYWLLKYL